MNEEKKGFLLKWPWNWVVYGVAIIAIGALIGLLWSILIVALFASYQKKKHPGPPQGGYCLDRTRKRLSGLGWGCLILLIGLAVGVYGITLLFEEKETMDYIYIGIAAIAALICCVLAVVQSVISVRDAFFPEKSLLAQSIRSQLDDPERAPAVGELFAMVDRDIEENGQWFDRIAIGKEWVLGDEASYIPRIRAVFSRDEIKRVHRGGRTQTHRVIEIHILDDRRQVQTTSLRDYRELESIRRCLHLRTPAAYFEEYSRLSSYTSKTDRQWQELEQEFQKRRAKAIQDAPAGTVQTMAGGAEFALIEAGGMRTSQVSPELLQQKMETLQQGESFEIEPLISLTVAQNKLYRVRCTAEGEQKKRLTVFLEQSDGTYTGWERPVNDARAKEILLALLTEKQAPDCLGWRMVRRSAMEAKNSANTLGGAEAQMQAGAEAQTGTETQVQGGAKTQAAVRVEKIKIYTGDDSQQERHAQELYLSETHGTVRKYDTFFTRRDVELAAQGMEAGKYDGISLCTKKGDLHLIAIQNDPHRIRVEIKEIPGTQQTFATLCSRRQAAQWLLDCFDGRLPAGYDRW